MDEENIIHLADQVSQFGSNYKMWWYKRGEDDFFYLGMNSVNSFSTEIKKIHNLYFLDGTLARFKKTEGVIIRILNKMGSIDPEIKKIILI